MTKLPPLPPVVWTGCYDDNWRDLIVPDAFAHPAKMARGLVIRIFDYLAISGALHKGDLVLDPFGGIGTTAIEGASRGMRVVCCELEPKFVELARLNIALHRRDWDAMGRPKPVIVEGDSRHLRTVLHAAGIDAVISSPPYAEIATGAGGLNTKPPQHEGQQGGRSAESASQDTDQRYGSTDGQLARFPKGDVEAVVSSPPYWKDRTHSENPDDIDPDVREKLSKADLGDRRYGDSEGQLGEMPSGAVDAVVSSPPFTQGYAGGGGINKHGYNPDGGEGTDKVGERTYQGTGAEREPGNLESLTLGAVEAVVSSPPYEGSIGDERSGIDWTKADRPERDGSTTSHSQGVSPFEYGAAAGQLGKEQGETFWHAAQQVVRECYALLKPGGTAVWVVKAFVRDKQLVDFPGDWRRLCEHAGFVTVEEIHASLVHEETIPGLFEDRVVTRERKSFFRRLAEKKGSPRIDWEVIWIMRKR
jgi:DNA modification methylase